jgi:spore maturation protein CgeB
LPDEVSTLLSGFDETVHRRIPGTEKDIDVLFVGTILPRREKILNRLQKSFNISVQKAFGEGMVELFNRANIVLNIHAEEFPDTETRIFESLGCGAFVISETLADESPFRHKEHIVEAKSIDVIEELIDYYLVHDEEREQIAMQGHEEALRNHTYTERAKQIASVIQQYLPYDDSLPAINPYKVKKYLRKEPFIRAMSEARQILKKYGGRILKS